MEMNWATLVLLYLLCTEINPAIALMLYGVSLDSEYIIIYVCTYEQILLDRKFMIRVKHSERETSKTATMSRSASMRVACDVFIHVTAGRLAGFTRCRPLDSIDE